MALMSSWARRSASRRACSRPFGASSGSPWPSTSGKGSPSRAGTDSPWRTRSSSQAPGGRWNRDWRYSRTSLTAQTLEAGAPAGHHLPGAGPRADGRDGGAGAAYREGHGDGRVGDGRATGTGPVAAVRRGPPAQPHRALHALAGRRAGAGLRRLRRPVALVGDRPRRLLALDLGPLPARVAGPRRPRPRGAGDAGGPVVP